MSPGTWESFFLAGVGAAAALGGLLFVAVSINLAKILETRGLADRALQALVILLAIMIVGLLMLMPNQPTGAIAAEILYVSVSTIALGTWLCVRSLRRSRPENRGNYVFSLVLFEIASLPGLIAGLVVLAGSEGGLYWLGIGICISFMKAVSDAWVFLVEINR